MFMDIGKTALPVELLNKLGRLTDDEWALMKSHVEHGLRILDEAPNVPSDYTATLRTAARLTLQRRLTNRSRFEKRSRTASMVSR